MVKRFALLFLLILAPSAIAEVRVAKIFGSDMVLQRDAPIPVWGWAESGEEVAVTLGNDTKRTVADDDGKWRVDLDALAAGGPYTLTIASSNELEMTNILVGDVWLASGQSNMVANLKHAIAGRAAMDRAKYEGLRLFEVERYVAQQPRQDIQGKKWIIANGTHVGNFSAVAYSFAERVHLETGVPIGMINASVGATKAEHWISKEVLDREPKVHWQAQKEMEHNRERWRHTELYPDPFADVEATYKNALNEMRRINRTRELAKREGRTLPEDFGKDYNIHKEAYKVYKRVPSGLYNAMLKPVIPFGIKGALWYQGESNAGAADQYARLLPDLIRSWRAEWGRGEFPFLIVSLAGYRAIPEQPGASHWAPIREVQWNIQSQLPTVWTALAYDLGDADDIHPRRKIELGERSSLIALAKVYDKDVVYSGPVMKSKKIEGDSVRITFEHAHGGLVTSDEQPPRNFAIASGDRKFYWANAMIESTNVVVLQADEVEKPVAVRYLWSDNADVNLYNGAGLPAAPFRTDDW